MSVYQNGREKEGVGESIKGNTMVILGMMD